MSEDNKWEQFWWDQKMGIINDLIDQNNNDVKHTTNNQVEQADWINEMYPETDNSALESKVQEQPQTVMEFKTDDRFAYDEMSINYEGEPVITLNLRTGDSTFGTNYDPDAAAEIFWDCVKLMIPRKAKTFTWEEIEAAWEENYPEGGFTIPLEKLATTLGVNPPRGTEVEKLPDPHYDGNGWNLNEKGVENLRLGGWTEDQSELVQVPPESIPLGTIYHDVDKDMTYFYDTSDGITNADWKEYYDKVENEIHESLRVPDEMIKPDEDSAMQQIFSQSQAERMQVESSPPRSARMQANENAYKRAMKVIE